jgi:tRNA(Ile)-lysidine synthase
VGRGPSPAPGPLAPGRTRSELLAEVARALGPIPSGDPVVVGCSGGPDSTALAFLVVEARPDLAVTLVHVRHGLREDDADDACLVTEHARWLGVACEVVEVEVTVGGRGPEAAARDARYAALTAVCARLGGARLLVGHTADDQAETVLLRLARGTGTSGLGGMDPERPDVVRPLLRLRRSDVRGFTVLEGLPTTEDPTNRDPAQPRARVRSRLLPELERVGPDPVGAIVRLADLARADAAALDRWAADVIAAEGRRVGPVRCLPAVAIDQVPEAVARRIVRHLAAAIGVPAPPSAAVVSAVMALAAGRHLPLPGGGGVVSYGGGWLAFAPEPLPHAEPLALDPSGRADSEVVWEPAGVRITSRPVAAGDAQPGGQLALAGVGAPARLPRPDRDVELPPGASRDRLVLAVPDDVGPLLVRHRAPGDRVRTAIGTQRIADVLIDAGVPRPVRALWPVVVSGTAIVWVPGIAVDHTFLVAGRRQPAAMLAIRRC